MSIDRATSATSAIAAVEASASREARRVAKAETPRPISGKRALLYARRLRERDARLDARVPTDDDRTLRLRTGDGAVVLVLRAVDSGLVIERTQRRPLGTCFVQTLLFTDREAFDRWLDADAMRFDEPALHDRLRREGHARLCGDR